MLRGELFDIPEPDDLIFFSSAVRGGDGLTQLQKATTDRLVGPGQSGR